MSDVTNVTDVHVTFDHVTRHSAVQFEYVDNPVVTNVRPLSGFLKYAFFRRSFRFEKRQQLRIVWSR